MARILIRNDTREILFFTSNSTFSDIDPRVVGIGSKYPGNTTFLTISNAAHVPNNLRLGAYIDTTLNIVSDEPFGNVLATRQRKAQLEAKLDEHKEMMRAGALVAISTGLAVRWYKYLRMMTQVSMRDDALSDAAQWALISPSLDVDPYDLDGLTTTQATLFDETFADEGEYALGWFDIDARTNPIRTDITNDTRLTKTNDRYDYRFASKVRLIPESEIDRTDSTTFPGAQSWTERDTVVAAVNGRFPWYVNNSNSLLQNARFAPRIFPNFLGNTFARASTFASQLTNILLVVHPRSHSATTRIVAGTLDSTTGSLNVPFNLGQTIPIIVTVTAGDGVHTSVYTYTITRRRVN